MLRADGVSTGNPSVAHPFLPAGDLRR